MEEMLNPPVKILLKKQWGGEFAKRLIPFEKWPIDNVRFTDTMSQLCTTTEECKKEMKRLQDIHINQLDLSDIQYGFYICGDGAVYEGRGWNVEGFKPAEYEHLKSNCVDIAFLIDLKEHKITPEMRKAADLLVQHGKNLKYLSEDCKLIDYPE